MAATPKPFEAKKFFQDLLIGGIAGTVSKTVVAPLERVKLLLQTQDATTGTKYSGVVDCVRGVYKNQGASSFWRGNTANVVRYFPTQAINFACKDYYQSVFCKHDRKTDFWKWFAEMLAAGGAAGATSLLVVYPLDFARTRLGADTAREFDGTIDCIKKIQAKDGWKGLYRGFDVSVAGIVVYRAAFFGMYDTAKLMIYGDKKKTNPLVNFGVGLGVETAAGVIAYPLDTIRRRMMMQAGREVVMYKNPIDCACKIWQDEGPAAFYKGCFSNIMRGVGGALVLVLYDELKKIMEKQNENKAIKKEL